MEPQPLSPPPADFKSLAVKSGVCFAVCIALFVTWTKAVDYLIPGHYDGKIPIAYKGSWQETVVHIGDTVFILVNLVALFSLVCLIVGVVKLLRRRSGFVEYK
jgi:hypothetical protein